LFVWGVTAAVAGWSVDVELGPVFSGYNDVRVPNERGSDISLSSDLDADPAFFYRVRGGYTFGERHSIMALAAPLQIEAAGALDRPVVFNELEIPAGVPIDATYRFDSYRLTYRYDFVRRPSLRFGLGVTAKVRDAAITLESGGVEAEEANTGAVPLINFALTWAFAEKWTFRVDGDALAAPQGRAEDVLVAVRYRIHKEVGLNAGYRMLEGGADVDEVYNFAMLHYVVVGPSFTF
jgi:hypothetical protein